MAYLFASSLGVPCDGLTGDGFWRFPECVSYPLPFSVLYFICGYLRVVAWSFSRM